MLRSRWAAIGAAIAVTLGAGGLRIAGAEIGSGNRAVFVAVTPVRVLDTRTGLGLTGRFADETPRLLQISGAPPAAVPAGATAVVANVTVVDPTGPGFLSVRPSGATGAPTTSNVNFVGGQNAPNSVTVQLPLDGRVQLWLDTNTAGGSGDVLVDVVGYYDTHNHDDRYPLRPIVTVLPITGNPAIAATGAFQLARTAPVFTKARDDTAIKLTLVSDGTSTAALYCQYQLRIDGRTTNGDAGLSGYSAAHGATAFQSASGAPFTLTGWFGAIAAGSHTVGVYVRGNGTCQFNTLAASPQLIIEEMQLSPASQLTVPTTVPVA